MDGPKSALGPGDVAHLDNVLNHYGIKGMRWGVRRANPSGGSSHPESDDAKSAKDTAAKIKSGGVKSLSNKELKDYLERMELEKRYNSGQPLTAKQEAGKFVKDTLMNIGKQEAAKFAAKSIAAALAKRG